jgi:hypothetical protein
MSRTHSLARVGAFKLLAGVRIELSNVIAAPIVFLDTTVQVVPFEDRAIRIYPPAAATAGEA